MDEKDLLVILQVVVAVTQVVSLVALVIYVIKTWEMASATRRATEITSQTLREMQATRDVETAPYVVVWFDVPYGKQLIQLIIKNIGKGMAMDVHVAFDPPLRSTTYQRLDHLVWLKDGIKSMPPDYEMRTLVDTAVAYFGDTSLPLQYKVRVTYYGGISSEERVIEYTLDLAAYKGIIWSSERGISDISKHMETLAKEHRELRQSVERISNTIDKEIHISNPSLLVLSGIMPAASWRDVVLSKLQEFVLLWSMLYRQEKQNGIGISGLINRSLAISDQIAVLVSLRYGNSSDTLVSQAQELAARIHELCSWQFYMDGGVSLSAFLEQGDTIVYDIKQLTEVTQPAQSVEGESTHTDLVEDTRVEDAEDHNGE